MQKRSTLEGESHLTVAGFVSDEIRVTLVLVLTYSVQGTPDAPFIQLITLFSGFPLPRSALQHPPQSFPPPQPLLPQPSLPALLTPQGENGQSRPAHVSRCRGSPFPSPHSQSGHGANPLPTPCPPRPGFVGGAGPNGRSARPHRSRSRSPRRGRETGRRRKGKRNPPLRRHLLTAGDPQGGNQIPRPDPPGPGGAGRAPGASPGAHRVVLAAQRRQRTGSCPVGPASSSCPGAVGN